MPRKYDSTVARMAGNIAAGLVSKLSFVSATELTVAAETLATTSVRLARDIVAEVLRTEAPEEQKPCL